MAQQAKVPSLRGPEMEPWNPHGGRREPTLQFPSDCCPDAKAHTNISPSLSFPNEYTNKWEIFKFKFDCYYYEHSLLGLGIMEILRNLELAITEFI